MDNNSYKNLGFGLGLRQKHAYEIIKERPKDIEWFEIISENYFNRDTERFKCLEKIRQDYPFNMHGVSLNIGTTDKIDYAYLDKIKDLAKWLQPNIISDHICWTGINHKNSHDLLPIPYTEKSLKHMVERVKLAQDYLGRQIALENPSTYLEFEASQIPEWEFVKELSNQADCLLLFDVNNVYVNCFNHGYDPKSYIDEIPAERIAQIHLAGHKNYGTHIIDTHDNYVNDEVFQLYSYTINKFGQKSTMIEWDANIPELVVMRAELAKVRAASKQTYDLKEVQVNNITNTKEIDSFENLYNKFQTDLLNYKSQETERIWIKPKENMSKNEQFDVYHKGYRYRIFEQICEEYSITKTYLGDENFNMLARTYIETKPSEYKDLEDYVREFINFAKNHIDEISAELLTLEAQISYIFEKPVSDHITQEYIQSLSPEEFLNLVLRVKNSAQILKFEHNVNDLYNRINEASYNFEGIKKKSSYLAISKESDGVYRYNLNLEEFNFIEKLRNTQKVSNLMEVYIKEHGEDNIQQFQILLLKLINTSLLN